MGKVVVKLGDIFEGGMDLTVLPCSAKGSISSSTERWKKIFGIKSPHDMDLNLDHGTISDPIPFPEGHRQTRYYVYAASVFNKTSSYEIIRGIGEQLGNLAKERRDIIHIESPLLGAGAGGLQPSVSGRALCEGFLSTSDAKSFLFIFANDTAKYSSVSQAVSTNLVGRLWDAVEVKPGFGGITVDLKKVFSRGSR